MRKGMPVQKKCSKKNEYFKNKLLAKRMFFIHGDIGGMGESFLLYGVDEVLPHITRRMNALFLLEKKDNILII